MNNGQKIALAVAAANLALLLLFPPYDYISLERANIPTFDGFFFVFAVHPNRLVNANFLALEIIVVLINACIGWLLLRQPPLRQRQAIGGNRRQSAVLALVAINLVLLLLFPPFEYFSAISKAALPSFEGFHFLFGDNSQRQLVMPILYIEVALVLINGGLLWLLFKANSTMPPSTGQIRTLVQEVRAARKK